MPTFRDTAHFNAELSRMQHDLAKQTAFRVTRDQARQAQKIARRAASADLGGDPKFSGWRPRLATQVKPMRSIRNVGHVLMPTRQSAGPWTVAERGRNQGAGGGGAFFGPGVNRRTGTTRRRKDGTVAKVRSSRGKRWNGYTKPKDTASEAVAEMERALPKLAEREATKTMRRYFDVR